MNTAGAADAFFAARDFILKQHVSATDREICLRLGERPPGLASGYADDDSKTADVMRDGYYHTATSRRATATGSA